MTDMDHDECVPALGTTFSQMQRLFEPLGFLMRGRMQNFGPGVRVACVYVFYNPEVFAADQRGLICRAQDLPDGGFEVVLSAWRGTTPVRESVFRALPQERYRVSKEWRGLHVVTESDAQRAAELLKDMKRRFEAEFDVQVR